MEITCAAVGLPTAPDDDEHLWTGHVVIKERSEWEGRGDGAQAGASERLNHELSYYWEILGVCRSDQRIVSY